MNDRTIHILDDDRAFRALLVRLVRGWGLRAEAAGSQGELWDAIGRAPPAVLLLDLELRHDHGLDLLPAFRIAWPEVPVLIVTGRATVESAVRALKQGAFDFLTKPLDFERLRVELHKALQHHRVLARLQRYERADQSARFGEFIGDSAAMQSVYRTIISTATTDATVLISGETGTGKELVARALHERSLRHAGPLVTVNCAALPEQLAESVLFGHARGAFTGATEARPGLCAQADGGTLFLDEVTEMPLTLQAKLLRFLEERVVAPVGGGARLAVDVRVVAATNRDPQVAIADGALRADLFYRLHVVSCRVPPLRERGGDIALLTHHFLTQAANRYDRPLRVLSPAALEELEAYHWPGNVRQLQHVLTRAVLTQAAERLVPEMLELRDFDEPLESVRAELHRDRPLPQRGLRADAANAGRGRSLAEQERAALEEAIAACGGNLTAVAAQLGISLATVYRKLKKYEIARAPGRAARD